MSDSWRNFVGPALCLLGWRGPPDGNRELLAPASSSPAEREAQEERAGRGESKLLTLWKGGRPVDPEDAAHPQRASP